MCAKLCLFVRTTVAHFKVNQSAAQWSCIIHKAAPPSRYALCSIDHLRTEWAGKSYFRRSTQISTKWSRIFVSLRKTSLTSGKSFKSLTSRRLDWSRCLLCKNSPMSFFSLRGASLTTVYDTVYHTHSFKKIEQERNLITDCLLELIEIEHGKEGGHVVVLIFHL